MLIISGCTAKEGAVMAKNGDTVKVHYTGKLNDGSVFDSSEGREPLEFVLGSGAMIQGFDKAVNGMEVGQSKTVTILAAEAYGPYQEEMVLEVNRDQLPAGMSPEVGEQLQMRNAYGGTAIVTVIETSDTSIKVDANHPLAGKDLIFELELVQVNP